MACENTFHFFGDAPMTIVPDNLKAVVTRSDRNEPINNEVFAATITFPARARHSKDKALAENAVKLMCRSVYADIEGVLVFHGLASQSEAIRKSLKYFNDRKMSGRKEFCRELSEEVEKRAITTSFPQSAIR